MTRVFGDQQDFAIEAGIDMLTSGTVYRHMCVWCRGVQLGDIDDLSCIFGTDDFCDLLAADADGRLRIDTLWADEFTGLDDIAVWNFLDGMLFGWHGDVELPEHKSLEEVQRDIEQWRDFHFLKSGSPFDGFKTFILRPPGDAVRILSRRLPPPMGRAVGVTRDGFVAAAREFVAWDDEIHRLKSFVAAASHVRPPRGPEAGDPWFPAEALAHLHAARFRPNACHRLEWGSRSFVWNDEAYLEFIAACHERGCKWFHDPLIYRSSLICGQPHEASRRAWDQLRRLCPDWPGFRPERSSRSLREELEREIEELYPGFSWQEP